MTDYCHIAPDARLGHNVVVGYGSRIHGNVVIGDDSVIGDGCIIGHPAREPWRGKPVVIVGGAQIRSHTVIYEGSHFGAGLETGHHVVIREGTIAGENLRVGNFSDIEGDCQIGDFCRFHGYTHVGKGSRIGHFVWLFSLMTATNDPLPPSHQALPVEVGDGAVVCVGATLMPGAVLGRGAFIAAGARVSGVVPPGAVVSGEQGRVVNHVSRLMHLDSGTRHPWMRHFRDAYPERAHGRIAALFDEIMGNRNTLAVEVDLS